MSTKVNVKSTITGQSLRERNEVRNDRQPKRARAERTGNTTTKVRRRIRLYLYVSAALSLVW